MKTFFKVDDTHYMGIPYMLFTVLCFVLLLILTAVYSADLMSSTFIWIFILSPVWFPLVLLATTWSWWRKYIRARFIAAQTPIVLEIKLPRQILKTPKAMEQVLAGLNVGPGETTFLSRWWEGKVRPWWSFEIVSIEGKLHYYVWAWAQFRDFVESQIYAQYPDIEIHEVEDYTMGVTFDPKVNNVWGMEYQLAKKDAYPIKTYIDFELDQDPKKPEQIVDPLSGVLEKLSSLGPGEQMWVQILARQNKGAPVRSSFWGKSRSWKDEAAAEIEAIYEKSKPKNKDFVSGEISEGYPLLKPAEVNTIKALERSIEKPGFDAGIRAVYLTRPDSFKGHKISPLIVNMWSTFNSGYLNRFKPGDTWHVYLDYPWQDFMNLRSEKFSRDVIDAYRRRSLFHPPYERPRFVLTTEELATIYHFPTEESKAPGIQRSSSKKGEPPTNLPI